MWTWPIGAVRPCETSHTGTSTSTHAKRHDSRTSVVCCATSVQTTSIAVRLASDQDGSAGGLGAGERMACTTRCPRSPRTSHCAPRRVHPAHHSRLVTDRARNIYPSPQQQRNVDGHPLCSHSCYRWAPRALPLFSLPPCCSSCASGMSANAFGIFLKETEKREGVGGCVVGGV
jgi:hypothetical protein